MLSNRLMRRFWFATVLAGALAALAVGARADEPQILPAYEDEPGLVNPYEDPPAPAPAPAPTPAKPAKQTPAKPLPPPPAAPAPTVTPAAPAPVVPAAPADEIMPAYGDEDILSAYAPLKVVGVMLDTGQALMWNEQRNEYVLGRVGDVFGGWKVMAIEESRVVVVAGGMREELPLVPAPTTLKSPREARKLPPVIVVAASPDANAPIMIPAPPAPPPPATKPPEPPAPPPPPKIIDETHKVSRAEFDTYLGDFDRLLREARVSEAAGGGFVFDFLDGKSWLYKMGLRQGDIVLSVAGDRVSSVEDAARVYAKLLKIKKFTVEIDRAGQRMNLHYDLSKP